MTTFDPILGLLGRYDGSSLGISLAALATSTVFSESALEDNCLYDVYAQARDKHLMAAHCTVRTSSLDNHLYIILDLAVAEWNADLKFNTEDSGATSDLIVKNWSAATETIDTWWVKRWG